MSAAIRSTLLLCLIAILTDPAQAARRSDQEAHPTTTAAARRVDVEPAPALDQANLWLPWRTLTSGGAGPLTLQHALARARGLLAAPDSPASAPGADTLRLLDSQRLRSGAWLLRFEPLRDGIPIHGERIAVLLDAEGRPRLASGGGRGSGEVGAAPAARAWRLDAEAAAGAALGRYGFDGTGLRGAWQALETTAPTGSDRQRLRLAPMLSRSRTGSELLQPPRLWRVWVRERGQLRPAWRVETAVQQAGAPTAEHLAQLVDASEGSVLRDWSLAAHSQRVWQAYVEPGGDRPDPGPQQRADFPHPTALPDGFTPALTLPREIALAQADLRPWWPAASFGDPWLAPAETRTRGNNVDAYADLQPPDGFSDGDRRASITAPGEFLPGYALGLEPDALPTQIESGVVNAFYLANYLHDWFYLAGFDEAAGNAQASNYGRGGIEGDALWVETLDHAGQNNANMITPGDGASPKMQLFPFVGPLQAGLRTDPTQPGLFVQMARFGPTEYRVRGALAAGRDGAGEPADGCEPLLDDHAGEIVLLERGGCTFVQKALQAQQAGAIGLLIGNSTAEGWPPMEGSSNEVRIPVQGLRQADAANLRAQLAQGPLAVEQFARRLPRRDAAMDAAIVAHEWGHYISNRLVGDAAGLSNFQGRAMGEGWADFHALHLLVRPQDLGTPNGANYEGSYGVMGFVSAGLFPSFSPNASYFGIRRYPYSTRRDINPLTLRHISTNSPLPEGPPRTTAPVAASNATVHNAGEIWASLLWECYAGLLRETLGPSPRYDFFEAQRRMGEYLVAGYKLTPNAPTYLEARDALLAAIAVSDLRDLEICGAAFASRGAGLRAVAPHRLSLSLQGVRESFIDGGDLVVDHIELVETEGCDGDGVLDAGERGRLRITVRNAGTARLAQSLLQVESAQARLRFPEGTQQALAPSAPQQQQTVEFAVALDPGLGREQIEFRAVPDDPAIGFESGLAGEADFAVDFDLRRAVSRSESFDAGELAWTPRLDEGLDPALAGWRREPLDALNAVARGPDFGVAGQSWLESPLLVAAPDADFAVTFEARYSFESDGGTFYDGGLIELSLDEGQSWQDVSGFAQMLPDYGGRLSECCDNPQGGRWAFVGNSAAWPEDFTAHRLDFGRRLAGQRVRLRFGVATDAAVSAPGWEIDDIRVEGLLNTPFNAVVADAGTCTLGALFQDGFESLP